MNNKSRIHLTTLTMVFMAISVPSWADDAGFEKCGADAKHAAVPDIKGMIFVKARKVIFATAWKPHVMRQADGSVKNDDGSVMDLDSFPEVKDFWSKGYKEVEDCAGTGNAPCLFNYNDKFGNRLVVVSVGEQIQTATIDSVQLLCPQK